MITESAGSYSVSTCQICSVGFALTSHEAERQARSAKDASGLEVETAGEVKTCLSSVHHLAVLIGMPKAINSHLTSILEQSPEAQMILKTSFSAVERVHSLTACLYHMLIPFHK
jgi:hypothetical protein